MEKNAEDLQALALELVGEDISIKDVKALKHNKKFRALQQEQARLDLLALRNKLIESRTQKTHHKECRDKVSSLIDVEHTRWSTLQACVPSLISTPDIQVQDSIMFVINI